MSLITPDFGLLVWMTLIFGVVFFILAKFGFPAITGMVEERSKRINESIAKAKEAEQKLASLAEEQARMIEETKVHQSRIVKETTEVRDRIIAQAREEAEREAAKVIEHAKLEIAAERESAVRDIRRQVAAISIEVAQKIIRKEIEKTPDQVALIERMVDEASKIEGVFVVPGERVHIQFDTDAKADAYLKTFLDFYLLSGAEKLYRVCAGRMYGTQFPLCASRINNRELIDFRAEL